jgi:hypothetical protein
MVDLMPAPSIDPLSQMLGEISAKLDMVTKTQAEDRVASATYRTEIRREVALVKDDVRTVKDSVTDLKNRVNNATDEMAEMRPEVKGLVLWRDQALGGWSVIKTIWVILLGLGATGLGAIVHALWPKS